MQRLLSVAVGLAALALVPVAAHAAPTYAYTFAEIGPLPGDVGDRAAGVNDSGQVAGISFAPPDTPNRNYLAFYADASGALTNLGAPSVYDSSAAGINDKGQVVGETVAVPGFQAFLTDPNGGALHLLGTLPGGNSSQGTGVNNSGQVAGFGSIDARGDGHAFISGPNGVGLTDLGTLPGGLNSLGYGINDKGQVVGSSEVNSIQRHAFLTGPNGVGMTDLGTLPGDTFSEGLAVNNSGQVTGYSETGGNPPHAFVSGPNGTGLKDIGTLPGTNASDGYGINDAGQVVGASDNLAFLYTDGVLLDLNTLIAPHPTHFFTLESASSISNTGYITGTLYDYNTLKSESFLLTPTGINPVPVPEASSVVSLGLFLTLGGLFLVRRKRIAASHSQASHS